MLPGWMNTARALALTQLLIVAVGAPLLHLLVKVQPAAPRGPAASFVEALSQHVLWLFLVPILYAVVGTALTGRASERAIRFAGILLCGLLGALLVVPSVLILR